MTSRAVFANLFPLILLLNSCSNDPKNEQSPARMEATGRREAENMGIGAPTAVQANGITNGTTANSAQKTQAERLTRFVKLLQARQRTLASQGATGKLVAQPADKYERTNLLDPRVVTSSLVNAIARYSNYIHHVEGRMVREGLNRINGQTVKAPPGFVTLEEIELEPGSLAHDASKAFHAALVRGNVWLASNKKYTIRKMITVPGNRTIASDGSAIIHIETGPESDFTTDDVSPVSTTSEPVDVYSGKKVGQVLRNMRPILVSGNNIVLRDIRLHMAADENDVQPLLSAGIEVRDAANVLLEGLELMGFPRTRGIIRVRSSNNVVVRDNLIHGSFTKQLSRQVTGIEIDNERTLDSEKRFINTNNFVVTGNFIFGLMLDDEVYRNTTFRGTTALGYETDGINIQGDASDGVMGAGVVSGNTIVDVGEAIDLFRSGIALRDNHVERCYGYGFKLVHGASKNTIAGNTITATGMAAIVVAEPATDIVEKRTRENVFVRNLVSHSGVFRLDSWQEKVPQDNINGIFIKNAKRNIVLNNEFRFPAKDSPRFRSAALAIWDANGTADEANHFSQNIYYGYSADQWIKTNNPLAVQNREGKPLVTVRNYSGWERTGATFDPNPQFDHFGSHRSVQRLYFSADVSSAQLKLPNLAMNFISGSKLRYTLLVARQTPLRVTLGDELTPFQIEFDLSGEGKVLSRRGEAVEETNIYRLSEHWYMLTGSFKLASTRIVPTIRFSKDNPSSNAFVDLGKMQVDDE